MDQIVETIDIDVPVNIAYNQWTQFESFPAFLPEVEKVIQVDDVTNAWSVRLAGSVRDFSTVITEQIPDDRIAWTSTGGDVDHAGVVTFHKLSDTSTRIAAQIDWEPKGALETVGAALNIPAHAVKHALQKFKEHIESEGIADGAWRGSV
jgi:uncharacterized membrane protein